MGILNWIAGKKRKNQIDNNEEKDNINSDKKLKCGVCGYNFNDTEMSCPKCQSIPIPFKQMRQITGMVVINYTTDEDAETFASKEFFFKNMSTVNPALFEAFKKDANHITYSQPAVLATKDDPSKYKEGWMTNALEVAGEVDKFSLMIQYGYINVMLESGIMQACHIFLIYKYLMPQGQEATTNVVALNRQIFPY